MNQLAEIMNKPAVWMSDRIGSLSTHPTWVNKLTETITEHPTWLTQIERIEELPKHPAWLERLYETSGLDDVMADLYDTFPDEADYDWENESIKLTEPDKSDISEAVQSQKIGKLLLGIEL